MNRRSLVDRIRRTVAEVARQIDAFETTGRPAEPRRREPVRRQQPAAAPPWDEQGADRRRRTEEKPAERERARRPTVGAALATRAGLRQAILMQEILGPPKGLRGAGSLEGTRPPLDGASGGRRASPLVRRPPPEAQ